MSSKGVQFCDTTEKIEAVMEIEPKTAAANEEDTTKKESDMADSTANEAEPTPTQDTAADEKTDTAATTEPEDETPTSTEDSADQPEAATPEPDNDGDTKEEETGDMADTTANEAEPTPTQEGKDTDTCAATEPEDETPAPTEDIADQAATPEPDNDGDTKEKGNDDMADSTANEAEPTPTQEGKDTDTCATKEPEDETPAPTEDSADQAATPEPDYDETPDTEGHDEAMNMLDNAVESGENTNVEENQLMEDEIDAILDEDAEAAGASNGHVPNGLPSHMTESNTDDLKGELSQLSKTMNNLAHKFELMIEQNSRPPSTFGINNMDQSLKGSNYINGTNGRNGNHIINFKTEKYPPIYSKGHPSGSVVDNIPPPEEDLDESSENVRSRGKWSNHMDFILSCLGYAVGLGNVWRFPYLCYKNGGGAFFIPYFIMLAFVGMPILFLELSLGQYTSQSCLTCWKFAPIFSGVGVAHYLISFLINIYYNVIIAWSFYYLFASMTTELPWSHCNNHWNTMWCQDRMPDVFCNETTAIREVNGTCLNATTQRFVGIWNMTAATASGISRHSSSSEFYTHYVLGRSDSIDEMGGIRWELTLCLLCSWLVIFFCLIKGVKSSGKAVWFTALFPYVVLTILLIRGLTLPGHYEGILYYTTPDFSRLTDSAVWVDAAVQIFFSLSACMGGLITLSSYNNFENNVLRDTLIVGLGNSATSIYAGFAVFSFLGYQAHELGTTVDKVATSGPGLAFVVYPDVITKMPASPLWAILFFIMLITLGMDSAFAGVEACVSGLKDKFPHYFTTTKSKVVLLGVMCFVTFALALSMCTEGGVYMLTLFDNSAGGWAMLVVGICESIALTWVYGPRRLIADIRLMCGDTILLAGPLPYWWLACWCCVTPLLLTAVLLFGFIDWSPLEYDGYMFPVWADTLGVLMTVFCAIFIPVYAIYAICAAKGSFLQRVWDASSPTDDWGPALTKHRRMVARYTPNFHVYPAVHRKPRKDGDVETVTNYDNPGYEF